VASVCNPKTRPGDVPHSTGHQPISVLGTLRRRGLVEGYFGIYRLTKAGVEQCRIIRTTTNAE
jgi:hypothetical protein